MRRQGITDLRPVAIFCESETLSPRTRAVIEAEWSCKVFAAYGMAERVVDAVECERHKGYHINMEYGILELVDKHGVPITIPGVVGRVVGTGLDTYHMPLIRYLTSDLASYAPLQCDCGRKTPLVQDFLGRTQELTVSKTGRLMPMYAMATGRLCWEKISEISFLQERPGELVARVVRVPTFPEDEIARELTAALYAAVGSAEFDVQVVFVHRVPRTQAGKISLIEQRLQLDFDAVTFDPRLGSPMVR
jgi:phenylacetate-CoA ligase